MTGRQYPARGGHREPPSPPEQFPAPYQNGHGGHIPDDDRATMVHGPIPSLEDEPVTQAQLGQLFQKLETLTEMRALPPIQQLRPPEETRLGEFEGTLSAGARAWTAVKWSAGVLAAGAAAIFAAGQWWDSNATKLDLDGRVKPIEIRVGAIEDDLKPIKIGVMKLVDDRDRAHELRGMKRKLAAHDRDYDTALRDWKRRPRGARPRKGPVHMKLAEDVTELENRL